MEFLFDNVNLDTIRTLSDIYPISGVTSNPSIIKAEGKINFFAHMREIRRIIGPQKNLHIQTLTNDADSIILEAEAILTHVDKNVFVKIPTNEEGLKAIKRLKHKGIGVTATAIYSKIQAYMAIAAGADYIAPYWNRMENVDVNPAELVTAIAQMLRDSGSKTKILAASFKNIAQVNEALLCGAHEITLAPELLHQVFGMASIKQAIADFKADWVNSQGDVSLLELAAQDK
jgi:TalC/MipB family fructose-6-phosphate aldolase